MAHTNPKTFFVYQLLHNCSNRPLPRQVLEIEEARSDLSAIVDVTWHIQQGAT